MAGTTDIQLTWVQTLEDAMAFKRWLGERRPFLAIDTETAGFDWWCQPLRTVQFGDRHHGWCLEADLWKGLAAEALREYDRPTVMHNMKFDIHFLEVNGLPVKRWDVHDTRAMAHIVNPAIPSGLKPRSIKVLGPWAGHGQEELKTAMAKGNFGWGDVPIDLIWKYAAFDTVLTAQLAEELYPEVMASYSGVYGMELATAQVLCDMERRGILTDQSYLRWAHEEWSRDLIGLKHQIGEEFHVDNPNSNNQVVARLRKDGWNPVLFTDKGNITLDSDVLGGIDHPLARQVLDFREVSKMVGTYVENLQELADVKGRIHASINPLGARTGRMSVSRPSLQNLPAKDGRIRKAFVAGQGNTLLTADYDQIEMRIFAHYSGSKPMLEAVRYGDWMTEQGADGYDFHSMSARMVYGIGADTPVPKGKRKSVKTVGFGKVYGAGAETLAAIMGCSIGEAQATIAQYESAFPETRKDGFPSKIAQALHERDKRFRDPHVLTAYGRKEPCWPSEAYKAVNYLIQGTAADVFKDRMIALSRTWLGDHMLLPIHDEMLFEVPDAAVPEAMAVIREVMPERTKFAVPLTVDVEATKRWGDLSKYAA